MDEELENSNPEAPNDKINYWMDILRQEQTCELISNPWFEDKPYYEGMVTAEFLSPSGTAIGSGKAYYNERGHFNFEFDVEETDTQELLRSLYGNPFGDHRICSRISLNSPDGLLVIDGNIRYTCNWTSTRDNTGNKCLLTITPRRSLFTHQPDVTPVYWVMPLYNFVCELAVSHTCLENHPLRLRHRPAGCPPDYIKPNKDNIYVNY